MVTGEVKLGEACSLEGNYDKPRKCIIKKQRLHFADKGTYRQSYGFSNTHVWMWELDRKEGWVPKNWCFEIVVLEKTLERPSYCNEIKPVNLKGSQPFTLIKRLMLKLKHQYFGHLIWTDDVGKVPDAGKDWGQKEKRVSEDEMAGRHHWRNEHELVKLWGMVGDREACRVAIRGVAKSQTQLGDWTIKSRRNWK